MTDACTGACAAGDEGSVGSAGEGSAAGPTGTVMAGSGIGAGSARATAAFVFGRDDAGAAGGYTPSGTPGAGTRIPLMEDTARGDVARRSAAICVASRSAAA